MVCQEKYGDADFTLETTGGSGNGALSYSVSANDVLEINGDTAKIVGAGTVTVTAVKAGGINYNETSATLDITIAKGDEPAIAFPTASELTYGQALSESTLTGGSTEYGTFAWKDGSTIPTIDNTGYDVVFKPNATALKNYNIEEKTRTIEGTLYIVINIRKEVFMAYVPVPKDLTKVKTKVAFNLTKRQPLF